MISLPRRQVRTLRAVFRRSVLGIGHRGLIPPLVLRVEGTQLRAQHRYAALAVEHVGPCSYHPTQSLTLPLDALADFEGRDDSPVILEAVAPDRTVVRWEDRGIPQTREYAVTAVESLAPFSEPPAAWAGLSCNLLDALAEASAISDEDDSRYALGCVQLRASSDRHEIVATDGRQVLIRGGFHFPWEGDVLIRHSPVFVSRELPRDRPVALGKTDENVALVAGPWTLFLAIQANARFPRVDRIVPAATATTARLQIDANDARFLLPALDRMPGADRPNAPATVDLNGRVAIRVKDPDHDLATELVLGRSRSTGTPVRFNTNRAFLARALRLGFTEVEVVDADTPLVCRAGDRVFAWQPLSQESIIEPTDDVTRIETTATPQAPARQRGENLKVRTSVSERTTQEPGQHSGEHATNGTAHGDGTNVPGVPGLVDLIHDAEALHEALGAARTRARRLIWALRRHRKQARLMSSTIAALKQLKLQGVGE